ncbi:MAG: NAD(P)-dependent alcohol dehydrogenase [Pseudomonadota bacterium]|nr:NAD(P)-dependent alcohol dehydrogenase [Pseudomonadota bacterium]
MKAWRIENDDGIDALNLVDVDLREPGPGEVRFRVMASSINRRDLNTVRAPGARHTPLPRIPNSDAAGEVISVGEDVTGFAPGDRVASCFFKRWPAGQIRRPIMQSALGGEEEGMLSEETILPESALVSVPPHLTWEEASTLTCAGVTAWHGLVTRGGLKAGDSVLLLGTGGVSIFALQFAKLMGARVIITSKSDAKLERARGLGADETINYVDTPDWDEAVTNLTGGVGVNHVVEVGGAGTLQKSVSALAFGGHIALIGVLTKGELNPYPLLGKSGRISGIYVGSREMFQNMNVAISTGGMRPVIDRIFDFQDAPAAYHCMQGDGHFGKIVIRVTP